MQTITRHTNAVCAAGKPYVSRYLKLIFKRLAPYHPILLAVYPILFLFAHNIHSVWLRELFAPILVSLVFMASIWAFAWLLFKDKKKSSIIASSAIFFFFSYGQVFAYLGDLLNQSENTIHVLMFLIAGLFMVCGYAFVWRSDSRVDSINQIFAASAIVLISMSVTTSLYYFLNDTAIDRPVVGAEGRKASVKTRAGNAPHVFLIVLDSYARQDVLTELYDYDNAPFLDYLEKKGFYVADKSTTNYCRTSLSLGSSLNLNYIQDLLPGMDPENRDTTPLNELRRDPGIARIFEDAGYEFVAFSTGYAGTELRRADRFFVAPGSLSEFQNTLLDTTILRTALNNLMKTDHYQYEKRRKQLLWTFDHIPDLAENDSPTFTFAHIMAPHPSFVFGPNGESLTPNNNTANGDGSHFYINTGNTRADYIASYKGQLQFINEQVKVTIDRILALESKRPSVIILQSDHGPGSSFDHWDPYKTNMKERMSILNAIYLPDKAYDKSKLYESITPVNTMRTIVDRYLLEMPLLPDRNFYAPIDRQFKFFEVTDSIGEPQ